VQCIRNSIVTFAVIGASACVVGEEATVDEVEGEDVPYEADDDADFDAVERESLLSLTTQVEARPNKRVGRTFHYEPCLGLTSRSSFRVTLILDIGDVKGGKFFLKSIRRRYFVTDNDPKVMKGALYSWSGTTDARKDTTGGEVFQRTGSHKYIFKVNKWYGTSTSFPAGVQSRSADLGDCCPASGCTEELQIFPRGTL
jgi:hypothetical protein